MRLCKHFHRTVPSLIMKNLMKNFMISLIPSNLPWQMLSLSIWRVIRFKHTNSKMYEVMIFYLLFDKLSLTSLNSHNIHNKTSNIYDSWFKSNILFHKKRLRKLDKYGRSCFIYFYLLRWRHLYKNTRNAAIF